MVTLKFAFRAEELSEYINRRLKEPVTVSDDKPF